ncbi:MAG: TIGR04338 family metallohydrolase [Actinomycetota bacterium]|nr:TIGR04338 family metallohydrolase [Actinomycetota bacterium]MDA2948905.1 TIGR04338 family metallohydrolase [Actinomycetota bacterium]
MRQRDAQRKLVYEAEQFARTLFTRAAQCNSRTIDFFGSRLTLPPEARFSGVESVQRYVDRVLALPAVTARWPQAGPVVVRARKGDTAAHYCDGVIAIPEHRPDSPFLREISVTHEVAHHLAPAGSAHGPDFVATHCELLDVVMGPEAGHVLRVLFARHGVR